LASTGTQVIQAFLKQLLEFSTGAALQEHVPVAARNLHVGGVKDDGLAIGAKKHALLACLGGLPLLRHFGVSGEHHLELGALDGFPETRFNIDIKSASAVKPTVRAILAQGASDRVLVTSFDERRRAAALRELPGVVSSASASRFIPALLAGKVGFSPGVRRALRGLVAVQVPERALRLRVTTERMLAQLHDAGVEVHVWTINDPQRMRELLALGVDGIVTDRADLALDVVRSL